MKRLTTLSIFFLYALTVPSFIFSQNTSTKPLQNRLTVLQERVDNVNDKLTDFNNTLETQKQSQDKTKVNSLKYKIQQLQLTIETMLLSIRNIDLELNAINQESNINLSDIQRTLQQIESKIDRLEESSHSINAQLKNPGSTMKRVMDKSGSLTKEINNGSVDIKESENDSVKINIINDILFASGAISLTEEGQLTIKKIADILKNFDDKDIFIIGHTDEVPISKDFQRIFPTNWELSVARGVMVTRYLVEEMGTSPDNITAGGRSFYQPVGNEKSKNRRTEIWIFPHIEEKKYE